MPRNHLSPTDMTHEQFTNLNVLASIQKLLPLFTPVEKNARSSPSSSPTGPLLISEKDMEELTILFGSIDSDVPERPLEDITQFASMHELLSVLIQAIQTHAIITMKNESCLSEISISNIVIAEFPRYRSLKGKEGKRQAKGKKAARDGEDANTADTKVHFGYLMDHTDDDDEIIHEAIDLTKPFKSIDALMTPADEFVRKPTHDLESFFYILLWISVVYSGQKKGVRRKKLNIASTALYSWYNGSDEACGKAKTETMADCELFEKDVLNHCALYFRNLKPLMRSLRKMFFEEGARAEVTHQEMIKELGMALAKFAPKQHPKL